MDEIKAEIEAIAKKFSKHLPGGASMKGLLVTVLSFFAAYLTYKWLKKHLSDLVM